MYEVPVRLLPRYARNLITNTICFNSFSSCYMRRIHCRCPWAGGDATQRDNDGELSRGSILFLRAVAFVHAVAFWVAYRQNVPLIGDGGVTPARRALDAAEQRGRIKRERRLEWRREQQQQQEEQQQEQQQEQQGQQQRQSEYAPPSSSENTVRGVLSLVVRATDRWKRAVAKQIDAFPRLVRLREVLWDRSDSLGRPLTTVLWFANDRSRLNPWLNGIALTGFALSATMLVLGAANVPLVLGLWICQRSLMAAGGPFYGYGWEPQVRCICFPVTADHKGTDLLFTGRFVTGESLPHPPPCIALAGRGFIPHDVPSTSLVDVTAPRLADPFGRQLDDPLVHVPDYDGCRFDQDKERRP